MKRKLLGSNSEFHCGVCAFQYQQHYNFFFSQKATSFPVTNLEEQTDFLLKYTYVKLLTATDS